MAVVWVSAHIFVQEKRDNSTKQQLNQNSLTGGQHLPHLTFLIFVIPMQETELQATMIKTILLD